MIGMSGPLPARIGRLSCVLLPALLLAWVAVVSTAANDAPDAPKVRFERTTHDFGKIDSDEVVEHAWKIHNDGGSPLEILGVKPQCGCTVTTPTGGPIPPGGSGLLGVRFDPAGMSGSIRKSLAVMCNDPAAPRVLLTILADVNPVPTSRNPGEHPPIAGQSMLVGECADCHATPAATRSGEPLYRAVCAMCHGPEGGGTLAPSIRDPDYLASHSDQELATAIAYGTANPKMPGFVDLMGGPLSTDQVDSLVRLMREWGPLSARDAPATATERP